MLVCVILKIGWEVIREMKMVTHLVMGRVERERERNNKVEEIMEMG